MLCLYLSTCIWHQAAKNSLFFNEQAFNWQWWRILTPGLLHDNFGHLLESTCWLIFLGYQVERFFGTLRFLLITLLLTVFSNCCQYYLDGGPFLGFSASAIGLGTFLWRRERSFKEKYFFPRAEKLILFAGNVFLCALAIAQTQEFMSFITAPISRFLEMLLIPPCTRICHFAHISAGILGWVLGGLSLFQQSEHRRSHLFTGALKTD